MARTETARPGDRPGHMAGAAPAAAKFVDRWIYVFMAALLIVVTLAGFIPDSFDKIDQVAAGKRPPFPLALHIHALVTGAWLLLLLAQTVLVATGRTAGHRSLGRLAMVLGPLLVIDGVFLAAEIYRQYWDMAQAMPPAQGLRMIDGQANTTLLRIKHVVLFVILLAWALRARRHDSATHKRLMILVPLSLMAVAFSRMSWLPTTMPASAISLQVAVLMLAAPMFLWDLYRLRRVQRAYVIWLALYLPLSLAVHLLWNSPWWLGEAPRLMGMQ